MDKNKMASDCYRKGVEAMEKKNWDFAIEMFGVSVKLIPDNLMYRQLLRNCEYQKYKNNKTGAGAFARSKLMGIRSRIKKAKAKSEWSEMDKACEEGLLLNPWDVQLNVELAEAAKALESSEIARFALVEARGADPNNKQLNWQLAEILEERGEYDEASKIWEHICKLDPHDGTARSRLTGSSTKKTMDRGGYEQAGSTRNVMVGKGPGKAGEAAAPGESMENDLKHAIRKEPQKVENYLKLADFYKREGKLEQAHQTLEQALQVSSNDANVREQVEDIELLRMKDNLDRAEERAEQGADDTVRKHVADLATEYNKRRMTVLAARIERYPQDLNLKYELGQLHMLFQKWSQAIPLLQQAAQNKRLKANVLVKLGQCFLYDKKASLAKGQLERAVTEINSAEDPKLFVQAHYLLGYVCEMTGDIQNAEKHYGEVLVIDYEYKDARVRLEKLQSGDAQPPAE